MTNCNTHIHKLNMKNQKIFVGLTRAVTIVSWVVAHNLFILIYLYNYIYMFFFKKLLFSSNKYKYISNINFHLESAYQETLNGFKVIDFDWHFSPATKAWCFSQCYQCMCWAFSCLRYLCKQQKQEKVCRFIALTPKFSPNPHPFAKMCSSWM